MRHVEGVGYRQHERDGDGRVEPWDRTEHYAERDTRKHQQQEIGVKNSLR